MWPPRSLIRHPGNPDRSDRHVPRRVVTEIIGLVDLRCAVAMAAASDDVEYYNCNAFGHYQHDYPERTQKNQSKSGKQKPSNKGGDGDKWCSCHRSKTHSDAGCHVEAELNSESHKGDSSFGFPFFAVEPSYNKHIQHDGSDFSCDTHGYQDVSITA